jgi:hypothetical protein
MTNRWIGTFCGFAAAAALAALPASAQSRFTGTRGPDYPTSALADYVVGCMAANGQTQETRDKCACSIDVITTLLPYDAYEEAEAFLSLGLIQGERGVLFRQSEPARDAMERLRRAQVEAELRCF